MEREKAMHAMTKPYEAQVSPFDLDLKIFLIVNNKSQRRLKRAWGLWVAFHNLLNHFTCRSKGCAGELKKPLDDDEIEAKEFEHEEKLRK